MHIHIYTFYETEMIPVAEAWGRWSGVAGMSKSLDTPFQQQAKREANSYYILEDIVTATISKMFFNS